MNLKNIILVPHNLYGTCTDLNKKLGEIGKAIEIKGDSFEPLKLKAYFLTKKSMCIEPLEGSIEHVRINLNNSNEKLIVEGKGSEEGINKLFVAYKGVNLVICYKKQEEFPR
ncbi:MAG: hypothetical protein QXP53_00050 [Candidatus Pacearchaeota archaeon]